MMLLNFETRETWGTAVITDLETGEVIPNVFWVNTEKGSICYAKTTERAKVAFDHARNEIKKIVRFSRFKVEIITKMPDKDLGSQEFRLSLWKENAESEG